MKRSTRLHRRRNVARCSQCDRRLAKADARCVVNGLYVCSDCVYWATRGVTRIAP